MKVDKNAIMIPAAFLAGSLLLSGCSALQPPVPVAALSDLNSPYQNEAFAQRFRESAPQGPSGVDSAIELSEKYARLVEETAKIRHENQNLTVENRQLKDNLAALDGQSQQAQKELTEANDLLMAMVVELNNWKADVIGFRDEIRGAEKAQLEALLKILKVLGGEVEAEPAKAAQEPASSKRVSETAEYASIIRRTENKPAEAQSEPATKEGEPE